MLNQARPSRTQPDPLPDDDGIVHHPKDAPSSRDADYGDGKPKSNEKVGSTKIKVEFWKAYLSPPSPAPKGPFSSHPRPASSARLSLPFSERVTSGTLLGPLSVPAGNSAGSKLGPTVLGNNFNGSSTLALAPHSCVGSPSPNAVSGVPPR